MSPATKKAATKPAAAKKSNNAGTMQSRLAKMKENWASAVKQNVSGFEPGTYIAQVQSAALGENSKGALQAELELLIRAGEHVGEINYCRYQLETELGPAFFRRDMEKLELEVPEDPTQLEQFIQDLHNAAPCCKIKITQQKDSDFTNTRILSLVDESEIEADDETAETTDAGGESSPEQEELNKLLGFCEAQGVEIEGDPNDVNNVLASLKQYAFDFNKLTSDEVAYLDSLNCSDLIEGRPATTKASPAKKATPMTKKAPDGPGIDAVRKFMDACGLSYAASDGIPALVKTLNEYDWEGDAMEAADVNMLRTLGVTVR